MIDKLTENLMAIDAETIRSLRLRVGQLHGALALARCMIRCGEHMSDVAEKTFDAALSTPAPEWEEVQKYMRHLPECNLVAATSEYDNHVCTCGLDTLLGRKP